MGSFRTDGAYAAADPALVAVIEAAAARSPYDVVMFSGARDGGGTSQHDRASAVDIVLIDPSTGQQIPNLGAGGEAFRIYEEFAHTAREVQQQVAPQLTDTFRWGGYFGPSGLNPTGADLMHFDLGSAPNMRMGSWEGGLNTEGQQFVAVLGTGRTYSHTGQGPGIGQTAPDGSMTYANLWGRAPLTGPIAPATGGGGAGATGPLGYAGSPAPLTGAAAAVTAMGAGGGDGGLPTLRNGAGNRSQPDSNVRALQEFLNANGQNLQVDGVFGDMTERAVRAYQEANGLDVDGVVGPQTWGHIAGTAAVAGGGEVSSIPGPVRGFVQRVFGDAGVTNLSARIDAFRNSIRKGMSPTDAFTQARGQNIVDTPAPGSPSAMIPPKNVPLPPVNPDRPAAPVIPLPRSNVERLGPSQGPVMPQEGVGPVIPPMQGPPSGPTQGPVMPGQVQGPVRPGQVQGSVMPGPMQGPFNDPALMPKGQPQSTVPTTPARNIGEGEYLPNEWINLRQAQGNTSQFPTYQQAPGAVPALIPDQSSPRMDAWSIKPLRREEGPLQPATAPPWGGEPGYSFMRRSGFESMPGPPGEAPPAQFGQPPPAPLIPRAKVPQLAPPNPTPYPAKPFTYDQFAGVEAPYEPPPQPEERPTFVPAAPAAKGGTAVDMRRAPPPAPVNMRVAPAKPAIPPPPVLPLVPSTKVAAAPPPKPVVPVVVRKKAA